MQESEKTTIVTLLPEAIKKAGSANKFATSADVSPATISQMVNNNWDQISDEMWRKVKAALRIDDNQWVVVDIPNMNMIFSLCGLARSTSSSFAVSDRAGIGKSESLKQYTRQTKNAFYIECDKHWTGRVYKENLLKAMGMKSEGNTEPEMAERIIGHLRTMEKPMLVIDEYDKLNDSQMMFFITMYNKLDGKCGFIISGSPALRKKIERAAKRNVVGFEEIYSRIGRKFVKLLDLTYADVKRICLANGITDNDAIREIFDNCENDLRRVKREGLITRERGREGRRDAA